MHTPKNEKDRWTSIRNKLATGYHFNNYWEQAINIFHDRITKKFFDPMQSLIDLKMVEGAGFTMVAIQCAVIEMFAAFREGKIFNHAWNAASPLYEYKFSSTVFIDFLHQSKLFEDHFWSVDNNQIIVRDKPFSAQSFYSDVRCGLLHEARTKANWTINALPYPLNPRIEKTFIVSEDGFIKIYRTVLHYRLSDYLKSYEDELREQNSDGDLLRKYFARKMDNLFDFGADPTYKWW